MALVVISRSRNIAVGRCSPIPPRGQGLLLSVPKPKVGPFLKILRINIRGDQLGLPGVGEVVEGGPSACA